MAGRTSLVAVQIASLSLIFQHIAAIPLKPYSNSTSHAANAEPTTAIITSASTLTLHATHTEAASLYSTLSLPQRPAGEVNNGPYALQASADATHTTVYETPAIMGSTTRYDRSSSSTRRSAAPQDVVFAASANSSAVSSSTMQQYNMAKTSIATASALTQASNSSSSPTAALAGTNSTSIANSTSTNARALTDAADAKSHSSEQPRILPSTITIYASPAPTSQHYLPAVSPSNLVASSTIRANGPISERVSYNTILATAGVITSAPILSFTGGVANPTASVTSSLLTKGAVSIAPVHSAFDNLTGIDPFQAIGTESPPQQLTSKGGHPVPTANIVAPQNASLQTNKFYANLFLGTKEQSAFALPYSISWAKRNQSSGATTKYGMAIQHADPDQQVNGTAQANLPSNPVSYYTNPLGLQQIVMTANELGSDTEMTADSLDTFSANANLYPGQSGTKSKRQLDEQKITFPLVQGMGFVTALYTSMQPEIQTAGSFTNVTEAGSVGVAYKYRAMLNDGTQWLIYVVPQDKSSPTRFALQNNGLLQGPANWSGIIQVARNPSDAAGEGLYDVSAGAYATSASLTGAVDGNKGEYALNWMVAGTNMNNQTVLGFALPHMVESFADTMNSSVRTDLTLRTPTKGIATAITSNIWTMTEDELPTDMSFTPWTPPNDGTTNGVRSSMVNNTMSGSAKVYSAGAVNAIYAAAQKELTEDMDAQTNLNSMYYAGKGLSKFASILIAVNDICQEKDLAQQNLVRLQEAFSRFTNNTQQFPLVYDTVWKGVVSSASYNGDSGADFGNTYYNDHHFHYGYFLHAAAVIAHLDPTWLKRDGNVEWVNALARDASNPSKEDGFFPVFRSFDWFHGHSWAHGLYETADGKDQESSSEDVMFSYGLKLWGAVTGDKSMEARGNLMLAVQKRSFNNYFLLEKDNKNQPADFIGNKVTGILFENKVDHTTYFGNKLEYIQGIHMLPLVPASALTRSSTFVKEEWDAFFADNAVNPAKSVEGGWKGVLYANLALIDPVSSWNFFADEGFDMGTLDGGASRTWYLTFAAGLGGGPQ